jgi:hypothetical protein
MFKAQQCRDLKTHLLVSAWQYSRSSIINCVQHDMRCKLAAVANVTTSPGIKHHTSQIKPRSGAVLLHNQAMQTGAYK